MMVPSVRPSLGLKRSSGGRFSSHKPSEATPSTTSSILSYFSPLTLGRANNNTTVPQSDEKSIPKSVAKTGEISTNSSASSTQIFEHEQSRPLPPTTTSNQQSPRALPPTTNGTRLRLTVRDTPSGASTPKTQNASPGPSGPATSKETRTLRSKDGGLRIKSDLSIYFADYEDIICGGLDKKPEFLRVDEPIYILDEKILNSSPAKSKRPAPSSQPVLHATQPAVPPSPHSNVSNAKTIALSSIPSSSSNPAGDPLPDSLYLKSHGRSERKEKQVRNIEKERAQHEKVHLERLLEGLQGPDWLRVMGVSGITEGEQKDWKQKRDYFITEVASLVDRFRTWKDEEKRIRLQKERAREEEDEEEDSASAGADSIDLDASAARQLQIEAGIKPRPRVRRRETPQKEVQPPPFLSFYSKPHLRAAAMGETRHGRNVTAFGHPIPDWDEREFALPDDYITPDALRANARKRRRRNRELKEANSDV